MSIEYKDNLAIVDEYSLVDFVQAIEKLVNEGYSISLEGSNYPQGMSGWYRAGLVKSTFTETTDVEEQPVVGEAGGVAESVAATEPKPKQRRVPKR